MGWRERLASLFGLATTASLLAVPQEAVAAAPSPTASSGRGLEELSVFEDPRSRSAFRQLAMHSSHSSHRSHASHSSHSSHYSGSGGGTYSPPLPVLPPPPPPPPHPAAPPARLLSPPSASGSSRPLSASELTDFIKRVQLALYIKGYDPGVMDGTLNARTQGAIKAYQKDQGLSETGNLDSAMLVRLGVTP
jgi:His-Xaa-Ser repeat protein HxsA